jgi:hypothetical protein
VSLRARVFGLILAALVAVFGVALPAHAQQVTVGSTEAAPGDEIEVSGSECSGDSARLVVAETSISETFDVDDNGDWAGVVALPADLDAGDYEVRAVCFDGGLPVGRNFITTIAVADVPDLPRTDDTAATTTTEATPVTVAEAPVTVAQGAPNTPQQSSDVDPETLPNTGLSGNSALSLAATLLVAAGLGCLTMGTVAMRRTRKLSATYLMSISDLHR